MAGVRNEGDKNNDLHEFYSVNLKISQLPNTDFNPGNQNQIH